MSKYKIDHWKVMQALAKESPKRPAMTTEEVLKAAYGGRADKERTVRNAYRMLRENEHVEIVGRGEYRLTPAGVAEFQRLKKEKFQPEAPKRRAPVKAKPKAKKAAKPKAKRPSPPKKAVKAKPKAKPATKKRPSPPKRPSAPAATKAPATKAPVKASESKSNGSNGGAKKRPSPPKKPVESKPQAPAPAPKPVTTGSTLEF